MFKYLRRWLCFMNYCSLINESSSVWEEHKAYMKAWIRSYSCIGCNKRVLVGKLHCSFHWFFSQVLGRARMCSQAIVGGHKQSLTVRTCGRLLNRVLPPRPQKRFELNRSSSNAFSVSSVINVILCRGFSLIAFNRNLLSAPINQNFLHQTFHSYSLPFRYQEIYAILLRIPTFFSFFAKKTLI